MKQGLSESLAVFVLYLKKKFLPKLLINQKNVQVIFLCCDGLMDYHLQWFDGAIWPDKTYPRIMGDMNWLLHPCTLSIHTHAVKLQTDIPVNIARISSADTQSFSTQTQRYWPLASFITITPLWDESGNYLDHLLFCLSDNDLHWAYSIHVHNLGQYTLIHITFIRVKSWIFFYFSWETAVPSVHTYAYYIYSC